MEKTREWGKSFGKRDAQGKGGIIHRDACIQASWSNRRTAHPLVQSLSWGSEIAACEYLYIAYVPFQRQRGQAKLISLCESLKSWDSAKEKAEKSEGEWKKERNQALLERTAVDFVKQAEKKLKRWETPLVKCKCMMFPPTRCTDHVSCIHSFSTRMRAEYSLYVIWFSFPSPSKWMAFLTHQLTCLTVPFCKHHLTPAVFSLP